MISRSRPFVPLRTLTAVAIYNPASSGGCHAYTSAGYNRGTLRCTRFDPERPCTGGGGSPETVCRISGCEGDDCEGEGRAETGPAELHAADRDARTVQRQPRIPGSRTERACV